MKKLNQILTFGMMLLVLQACGSEDTAKTGGGDSAKAGSEPGLTSGSGTLSIMEGHGLREEAGDKAKWVTAVAFGEVLSLTGDTATDDKGKVFVKVKLNDGKTAGWVDKKYIAEEATLGVMVNDAELHSRPNITNNTDKYLKAGDLIVVVQSQGDNWNEVVGKGGKYAWGGKGWITGTGLFSTEAVDIEVADRLAKALSEKDPARRNEKLNSIVSNVNYEKSLFYEKAQAAMESVGEVPELAENEMIITGDNVNMRAEPSTSAAKVSMLSSGTVVKVLGLGEAEELNGVTDLWYHIEVEGKEGWVFGQFTSRAK